jgi:hypothetical protein
MDSHPGVDCSDAVVLRFGVDDHGVVPASAPVKKMEDSIAVDEHDIEFHLLVEFVREAYRGDSVGGRFLPRSACSASIHDGFTYFMAAGGGAAPTE